MTPKQSLLAELQEELDAWDTLLARLTQEARTTPDPASNRSVKDDLGHLRAWQQISIARFEAARDSCDPVLPGWLAGQSPFDAEEDVDTVNVRIYNAGAHAGWRTALQAWHSGFQHLIGVAKTVPAAVWVDPHTFTWLRGYMLIDVAHGTLGHHREHRKAIEARLLSV